MEQTQGEKNNLGFKAFFPMIVFVLFYFGLSAYANDFSKIPMSLAFIVSATVAILQNRQVSINEKVNIFATGMGNIDIMIMCYILILAGAFASSAQAAGGVQSIVIIAKYFISVKYIISGLFVISALISISIGTSCGTIAAIAPIAVSLSQNFGLDTAVVLGATVGGAMFGDNLSIISDTTIAATRSQNVEMRDKMLYNLKIVAIPALICVGIYVLPVFTQNSVASFTNTIEIQDYIKTAPYILLLVCGFLGANVILLLCGGIFLNICIGLHLGSFEIFEVLPKIGAGIISMADVLIIIMLVGGIINIVRYNGGISYIINTSIRFIKSKKLCELNICTLVGLLNVFTASNTVAIVSAGPIAKELSRQYNIDAKKTASLLDITSCIIQGFLPYGAQILIACGFASAIAITPIDIIKVLYYPMLMTLGIAGSILFEKKN